MTTDPVVLPPRLGIALSGGGYRASLLACGSLLAVVDRGLNERVVVVSSVSGGSITNAVVARNLAFDQARPGDLDSIAEDMVRTMTSRTVSVLPPRSTAIVSFAVPAGILFGLLRGTGWPIALTMILAVAFGSAYTLLSVGRILAVQLGNVFAIDTRLGAIQDRQTAHEFCATDLLTGMPVTFSTSGAVVRRRYGHGQTTTSHAASWQLRDIVRASAAFPGVPPKVARLDPVPAAGLGGLALCADGGIWNNLATQVFDEVAEYEALRVLCVNASARARPARAWVYFVPGCAHVATIIRTMTILSRNTVEPRVEAIDREVAHWTKTTGPDALVSPFTVVADMRPIADAARFTASIDRAAQGYRCLQSCTWWNALVDADPPGDVATPTRLSRISRNEAATLVRRGYANTLLASLVISPVADPTEFDACTRIIERLARVTPARRRSRPQA